MKEPGAAPPARCLPHSLPRRITHPPRLLPGLDSQGSQGPDGLRAADWKTKGRTPRPCAKMLTGTDGQTALAPASLARQALGPGFTLPGAFPETALTLRGALLDTGCLLGSALQHRGWWLSHLPPSPRAPGARPRTEGSPHTVFLVTLTAVSLGSGSPHPTVHTRKQRPREVNPGLKVTLQAGGRAGV